jgi:nitrate reductase delta subunit
MMGLFNSKRGDDVAAAPRHTLRALARLLTYPDVALRASLPALREALRAEARLTQDRLDEIDHLIESLRTPEGLDAEANYVELFDRGRSTSLHLFEHVHGDSRDRGPAMIDLHKTYEAAGLYLGADELPDYLPVVLEYASTQPRADGRAFLAEMAHILNALCTALTSRRSNYAAVIAAVLELAGERVQPVKLEPEESIDDTWAEPPAFDGCSVQGQGRPGAPQRVNIDGLARRTATAGAAAHPANTVNGAAS